MPLFTVGVFRACHAFFEFWITNGRVGGFSAVQGGLARHKGNAASGDTTLLVVAVGVHNTIYADLAVEVT